MQKNQLYDTLTLTKKKRGIFLEELIGTIDEIIYQNEMNSYTVANFQTEQGDITIVGYLPFIVAGDTLKLLGKIVVHPDYGEQFKVETFEKIMPQTLSALEKYLANGNIKGVGPATAKKIVQKFGEETISILKFEPQKLTAIKGITVDKALQISEDFIESWELWQIVGFLEQFGIGVQNAKNVYKALGANAVQAIEENPYILVDIVHNVDFKKIDQLALKIGIPYNNHQRIQSGIKYAINCTVNHGHCRVLKSNLIPFVSELLKVTKEEVEENLIVLRTKEEIIIESDEKQQEWIYFVSFYRAEENIANRITLLNRAENIKKIPYIEKEMQKIEKNSAIELSDKQKEAIIAVNENNVCIITGGPGTGKTTIIKTMIQIYQAKGKKVVLCAPTGRAAKRMSETTGEEAKTLHRLLEIGKMEEDASMQVTEYDVAPIDADVVIVDEASMVDIFLMNYLVKALFQGTKLVLVGDVDQLPSVGPGSILKDLIQSQKIATITLNKIFRQAAKSKIIVNAHRVNEGEELLGKEEAENTAQYPELKQDFFFIQENHPDKIVEQVISLCSGRLQNFGNYDFFKNIQVLTPTKKGSLGTKELNKVLQKYLNPPSEALVEKRIGDTIFREKDRVMQVKNNYDIYWERRNTNTFDEKKYETGSGVFNGELGIIERINEEEKTVKIHFDDDKYAWYDYQELEQIEHAYAITIHKAQRK